jgi:hypothetical protein
MELRLRHSSSREYIEITFNDEQTTVESGLLGKDEVIQIRDNLADILKEINDFINDES